MMKTILQTAAIVAVTLLASAAGAQSPTVDHLTQADLLAKAQQIAPQATETGLATVKLADYPNHFTMITLRNKSGIAEVHEQYADVFLVLRGKATLVTGGTVPEAKTVSPGEIRGAAVQGGTQTSLTKGDVVHIPAKVPHQLLLPAHSEFVYFVIKVKELE